MRIFFVKENIHLQKTMSIPLLIKIIYTQIFNQQMITIKNTINET